MRGTAHCEPASVDATKAPNQSDQTAKWEQGSAKVAGRATTGFRAGDCPHRACQSMEPMRCKALTLTTPSCPRFRGRGEYVEHPARGWLEVLLRGMMPVIGEAPVYAASRKTIPLDGGHDYSRPPATIALGLVSRQAGAWAL